MTRRPLGINTYGYMWTTPFADCVRDLHAQGYDEFELILNPPHLSLEADRKERARQGAALREEGIRLRSLNVPSLDANLASSLPRMRAYSVQVFRDSIDLCADLGIPYLVTVPGRMNALLPPTLAQRQGWMRESIDLLLPYAKERGVCLALENIPFASFPDAASLGAFVRSYDDPTVRATYDVANAHFIGESPAAGLRELKELVKVVHLSDTNRTVWKHDEVGLGDVPFGEVVPALDEIGFDGPVMMEIVVPDPLQTLLRSHRALEAHGFSACPTGGKA